MSTNQTSAVAALEALKASIIHQARERGPHNLATSKDLLSRVNELLPEGADAAYILSTMLVEMTQSGELEA